MSMRKKLYPIGKSRNEKLTKEVIKKSFHSQQEMNN